MLSSHPLLDLQTPASLVLESSIIDHTYPANPPLLGGPRRFAFHGSLRTSPHIRVRAFRRSDEILYLVGNSSGVTRRAA
jgi:hypothetical protein